MPELVNTTSLSMKGAPAFSAIATAFPLAPAVLALYTGGSRVTDSGDPRSIVRDSYANGLRKLIVHLASELPLDPER